MGGDLTDDEALRQTIEEIVERRDKISLPQELTRDPAPQEGLSKSLVGRIREMSVGEKIKLALHGNREARTLLLRDSNRIVRQFVLQNPRISEDEVAAFTRNRNADDDLLREVGRRREWMKNYQIRLGLVQNPRTPHELALRCVGTLHERDIRVIAKSKNVPTVVSAQARRILLQKQSMR